MKVLRITNGFTEMTDATLLLRANSIVASMTGNPAFTTPTPTLAAMSAAITAFQEAVQAAEGGDRQLIAVRNQVRSVLVNDLHMLGNYVLFLSAGDDVKATSSGFHIARTAAPLPPLMPPQGLVLKNGINQGELKLGCRRMKGAYAYQFEITPVPVTESSQWQTTLDTVSKHLFSGLESGREYACRVAAIGTKEQKVYSGIATRMAM